MKALQGTKIQNAFLETLINSVVNMDVDGQLITAKIRAADQFHIVAEVDGHLTLISKSSISMITAPKNLTASLEVNIEAASQPRAARAARPNKEFAPRPQVTYKPRRTYP